MSNIDLWKGSRPLKAEVEPVGITLPPVPERGPDEWSPTFAPSQVSEQRASQRYPAVEGRCWLGWHEGTEFREIAAWILNISASGCLVAADAPGPTDRPIWLRLDAPACSRWVDVRIMGHQSTDAGILASRLVFRGACPYDLMKAVAFATSARRAASGGPSPSWSLNSW
jgi:hypothetical protein